MSSTAKWESIMTGEELRSGRSMPSTMTRTGGVSEAVRPLMVRREDAAQMLGMSVDSFERHVISELAIIRVGRMVLVPVSQLEGWISRNASTVGGGW